MGVPHVAGNFLQETELSQILPSETKGKHSLHIIHIHTCVRYKNELWVGKLILHKQASQSSDCF